MPEWFKKKAQGDYQIPSESICEEKVQSKGKTGKWGQKFFAWCTYPASAKKQPGRSPKSKEKEPSSNTHLETEDGLSPSQPIIKKKINPKKWPKKLERAVADGWKRLTKPKDLNGEPAPRNKKQPESSAKSKRKKRSSTIFPETGNVANSQNKVEEPSSEPDFDDDLDDSSDSESSLDEAESLLNTFHPSPFAPLQVKSCYHDICKFVWSLPRETVMDIADGMAENHLDLFLEHALESGQRECVHLMFAVLISSKCDLDHVLHRLICMIGGKPCSFPVEKTKELEMKVLAIRFIADIITHIPQKERLNEWITEFSFIFLNFLAAQNLRPGKIMTEGHMTIKNTANVIEYMERTWCVQCSIFAQHRGLI
ncbi:uncharacterized protein LOC121925826 [Sceloporus undulatus]|uniref:uncharacterized protein LOC121925826 n=1 Tax=Sceloporus undulatus TaxID=8520 RepID=UPI001C4D7731|nr:uncharacterized protein LOC121925826 [Sceloporus undulatus]